MIETNPEIIEKTEKRLRNKYGVLMLVNALLSTAFGLFGFIASIMEQPNMKTRQMRRLQGFFLRYL